MSNTDYNPANLPPLDDSQDDADPRLTIQTGQAEACGRKAIDDADPANDPQPVRVPQPPTPWQPDNIQSRYIVGDGDCFMGKVGYSYDKAPDAVMDQTGTIDVQHVAPYGTGEDLELGEVPPAGGSPNAGLHKALPLPRPDQKAYHAKADDPVLVLAGRDGRAYYIPDDAPFIGTVGASPGATLSVTRMVIAGDPASEPPDVTTATSLTYPKVFPITANGQHHGYFEGDTVLCIRRGEYVFCLPTRCQFHGQIKNKGPGDPAEDDFDDERYWVKIIAANITVSGNSWGWGGGDDEIGNIGIVCAANLAEVDNHAHLLRVDGSLEVVVTLLADSGSGAGTAYWVFALGPDRKVAVSSCDTTPGFLRWTDGDDQAHDKIIGDAEKDAEAGADGEPTGAWIKASIINAGLDEQLKIEHVGPGECCYSWSNSCYISGGDIDEKGHVRYLRYWSGAGSFCCVGPCA